MGVVELLSTSPLPLPLAHPSGWTSSSTDQDGFFLKKLRSTGDRSATRVFVINYRACDDCSCSLASSSPPRGPQIKQRQRPQWGNLALTECLAERIARYVSVGGSARACGVGVCPRLVPTLGGPGEASRPRTGGIHRLDHPRTPGASRPRGREDPSWVAAMACLWVDVLSKTKPGDTGPRRPQDSHWRDHGLGSSHTANPQNTVFTPKFSPYRSLWTMNDPNGPQTASAVRCVRAQQNA